ncbi:hypothetical protein SBDP1_760002 [Syntrophobacter sp. SbD1]|nr:hypothetical protein SBDP1_760002 [Syntrophobacter sp. SbD1]
MNLIARMLIYNNNPSRKVRVGKCLFTNIGVQNVATPLNNLFWAKVSR